MAFNRSRNTTNNTDSSDNSVIGLQDDAQNFQDANNISISNTSTDGGAVASATEALSDGFKALLDGFNNVVDVQGESFDSALGFSGDALEESANIVGTVKTGESFSTVANSKNIMIAGGLLAAAIIAVMVIKK
ncbi:MAG: hypothetical protein QM500_02885 [Methylococcales bacterium]